MNNDGKTCNKCKEVKPYEKFYLNSYGSPAATCMPCYSEYQRMKYYERKAKKLAKAKEVPSADRSL